MLLGKKTNTETILKFFQIFQFHIGCTQQIPHWTITATLPRINLIQRYERNITHDDYQLSTKPIQQKRLEIMKMMVSLKQKETFEEESFFENIVCYVLYLIVGVL